MVVGAYKPGTIASFVKFFLLKQKSMITKEHLELGKALLNFPSIHTVVTQNAQLHDLFCL